MGTKTSSSHPWTLSPSRRLFGLGSRAPLFGMTLLLSILWTLPMGPQIGTLLYGVAFIAGAAWLFVALARRNPWAGRALDPSDQELEVMRRVDADLRAAVARHQTILESLSGGFVMVDRNDRVLQVSSGALRVLGSTQLRVGASVFNAFDATRCPSVHAAYRRAVSLRTVQEVETNYPSVERWLAVRIEPGSATTTLFLRDVTDQRRTLARVEEAEASFRLFAENVQDVFWVVDVAEQRPVYASPSWERLTGLPTTALYDNPRRALDLVHSADRERFCEHLLRCRLDDPTRRSEIEFRIVRPDGATRWIHQRSVIVPSPAGGVARLCGIASDVTDRKQMVASLRESEQRFRGLSESSPVGIFRTDLEHRVIYVNARMLEICGAGEELVGQSLLDTVHPEDREGVAQRWRNVDHEGGWECRFVHGPGGSARTGLMRVVAERDAEGRQVGYIGTLSDLTDYREVQSRLLLSERMASLGTLAAGVGHEINNPLTYLMCNLELATRTLELLRDDGLGDPESARERVARGLEHLGVAFEGSCRIRDIVRELRVFARGEREQTGAVDAVACMEAALSIAQNQVRHRATIVRKLEDVPLVRANDMRLGQVLLNLVVNAAQAMPEGRAAEHTLTVSTRLDPGNRQVLIEVSDTGSGIRPELLARIFDPFFTTKSSGEGTGLGLFLAQQAVQSYGGAIEVESVVGQGSTFRVRLPQAEESTKRLSEAPTQVAAASTPRARVLVIDDEREVGLAVAAMLENEHDVTTAEAGSEALELLRARHFDLVLCDLMMPTMTASEFFAELKRLRPEQAERVCFMTGGVFTEAAHGFLESAGRPLINKPFSLSGLRNLVARSVVSAS